MGSAQFFMWGGLAPYTFVLDGDTVSNPVLNLNSGTYDIVITDANGCMDTVNFVIGNTATADLEFNDASPVLISVSQGEIRITSPNMDEVQRIELFNMMGALVLDTNSWKYDAASHSSIHRIDDLAKGIYRVVLTLESSQISLSVSVQ